jgi:cell division protein YceG involved in septum cleavage
MFKILRNLKSGPENFLHFTVSEGSNVKQTAEIISRTLIIDKKIY